MPVTDFASDVRPTPALKAHIGGVVRQLREKMGRTQADACVEIWGSEEMQGQWSKWERGKTLPHIGSLYRIARWAGVSLDVFSPASLAQDAGA